MKKRIGLLYGGKSAEHEVSLATALAVSKALNYKEYDVYPVYITSEGEWKRGPLLEGPADNTAQLQLGDGPGQANDISEFLPTEADGQLDVIVPLLHGPNGEDGTVQGLLEVLNLPYVGNGVLASAAGMDKVIMKQLFSVAGLKQTPYVYFLRSDWQKNREQLLDQVETELTWPVFVKPANLGSSVGISKAQNRDELNAAVLEALKFDRKVIVEQGVNGREIEIAVLGNDEPECSVAGEIKPLKGFYDYEAKYKDGDTALVVPAELDNAVYEQLADQAKRAFKILDCSGLVRADFFVTEENDVLINEVNTMPGFTPYSMFPLMWQQSGLSYPDLIEQLINLAIERHREKQQLQSKRD
ncbi:D-alanine--D-alanine ligase [Planococcus lenghuensis]|uniref:D-alanine--D-alanine ligase n=1 Tax=Planococcus lenghuensis TaxID=2213202 RepID=A0A1Q2KVJ3_9BACL|nr:D-alanine--D-alanine ligase [Planococcus lenghuensis]AQQ52134.1 D-alanine--D-alanine ligase A [Planococcus lenghuensis]